MAMQPVLTQTSATHRHHGHAVRENSHSSSVLRAMPSAASPSKLAHPHAPPASARG